MPTSAKTLRTCPAGHQYYKSSDCPTCPSCDALNRPDAGFLSKMSAPARRALENAGITDLKTLATHREKDLLKLHGFGKASLPGLRAALEEAGLTFKNDKDR